MARVTVGLAQEGVWPGGGRQFASPLDIASAFADEVLGWDGAEVVLDPAAPNSPVGLAISHGPSRSVWALAAPLRARWTFMQIGDAQGLSAHAGGENTHVTIPAGPRGTASMRWWILSNGQESTGVHTAPTGPLLVPAAIEHLDTVLAVYQNDHQVVLGAVGGDFGDPTYAVRPNQT